MSLETRLQYLNVTEHLGLISWQTDRLVTFIERELKRKEEEYGVSKRDSNRGN